MDRSLRTLELSHRQTSNFEMCLLYFIHTCNILFNIKDYLSFTKKNWPRFSLPTSCRSSITSSLF